MSAESTQQGRFVQEMISRSLAYCAVIDEVVAGERPGWLRTLCEQLPSLHVVAAALPEVEPPAEPDEPEDDLDERFELYACLLERLGEHDRYWLEFDPIGDHVDHGDHTMSGSLADDLVDIYFDLRRGLHLFQAHPDSTGPAVDHWRQSYRSHWGPHLVDAERHLYALKARDHLDH